MEQQLLETMNSRSGPSHFFNISVTNRLAKCKICHIELTCNIKQHGTSSLKRHIQRKHPNLWVKREDHSNIVAIEY